MDLSKEQQRIEDELRQNEINKNIIHVIFNNAHFTQLCKMGFFVTNTTNGRVEIPFYSDDIITLCKIQVLDKIIYDKTYRFIINGISNEDVIEILKRTPMFSSLVERL